MDKYMRDIATSSSPTISWVQHDEQNRLRKEDYPDLSLREIVHELWVMIMSFGSIPRRGQFNFYSNNGINNDFFLRELQFGK